MAGTGVPSPTSRQVSKAQRGGRTLTARPRGAARFARGRVATLGKVAYIPRGLRFAAKELGGSESCDMNDEVNYYDGIF